MPRRAKASEAFPVEPPGGAVEPEDDDAPDEPKAKAPPKTRTKARPGSRGPVPGDERAKESGARGGTTRAMHAAAAKLEEPLLEAVAKGGASLSLALPLTGGVVIRDGESLVTSLLRVAERNPKMLKALQTATVGADYSILLYFVAEIGVAAAVELGAVPVDGSVSRTFGIDKLADELGMVARPPEGAPAGAAVDHPAGGGADAEDADRERRRARTSAVA